LAGAIDVSLTYFPSDLMQPPLERLNFCGAHRGQLTRHGRSVVRGPLKRTGLERIMNSEFLKNG
jgi:hypothetical protein